MNFGKVSIFCYQFISHCTIGFQSSCSEDVVLIFSQRLSKLLRCTSMAHRIFLTGMFPCQHLGMFYHSQLHVQPLLMELSTYRLSQLLHAVFSLTPSAKMLPELFSHHEQQHDLQLQVPPFNAGVSIAISSLPAAFSLAIISILGHKRVSNDVRPESCRLYAQCGFKAHLHSPY